MKKSNIVNNIFPLLIAGFVISSLISCGSSKDTTRDDDGIYDTNEQKKVVVVKDTKSDYYQDYFSNENEYYETDEDEIFTDIDEYKYEDTDTLYVEEKYVSGNAPWEYATNVSVNFYAGFGGGYRRSAGPRPSTPQSLRRGLPRPPAA